MNMLKALSYGVLAFATIATSSAFAGVIQVSFDENGNGSYQDSTAPDQNTADYGTNQSGSIASFLGADPYCASNPGSCVGGNVLIFKLPTLVLSGPVDVGEPGDVIGSADPNPSDVLFFTNSAGVNDGALDANLMVFYSGDIGGGFLADTGLPSNAGTFLDQVNENPDGTFQWLPDGGTFPNGNEYDGVSGTPEPASMALIGAGMLGLGLIARKRRSA